MNISIDLLRSALHYDPLTGLLTWRVRVDAPNRTNSRFAGRTIRTQNGSGYIYVCFRRTRMGAHRVAWAIYHGAWPDREIDHINGIKADNRIANLRLATSSQNKAARPVQRNNVAGIKGVRLRSGGRWQAIIRQGGRQIHLGMFDTAQEAATAYIVAAERLYGDFAHRPPECRSYVMPRTRPIGRVEVVR
jgi:hypothetical protein